MIQIHPITGVYVPFYGTYNKLPAILGKTHQEIDQFMKKNLKQYTK